MALFENGFEGTASGTAVSTANSSASGSAFSSVSANITYSNEQAMHGTQSARFNFAAVTTSTYLGATGLTTDSLAVRAYVRFSAVGTDNQIVWIGSGASTRVMSLLYQSDGKIRVYGPGASTLFTTTGALPLDTWVRLELYMMKGASTSTGTIAFAMYLGDSTTAVSGSTFVSSTANTGVDDYTEARFGRGASNSFASVSYFDDVAWETAADGFIGPVPEEEEPPRMRILVYDGTDWN